MAYYHSYHATESLHVGRKELAGHGKRQRGQPQRAHDFVHKHTGRGQPRQSISVRLNVLEIEVRPDCGGRARCPNSGDYQQRLPATVIGDHCADDRADHLYAAQYDGQILAFQIVIYPIEDQLSVLRNGLAATKLLSHDETHRG